MIPVVVNEKMAEFLRRLGWVCDRDFAVTPSLPDDCDFGEGHGG